MRTPARRLVALLLFGLGATFAQAAVESREIAAALAEVPPHPRLFLNADGAQRLQRRIEQEPIVRGLVAQLVADAERELATRPVERVLIGRRLLDKSRTALRRTLTLALAWRITRKPAYLERARAELLAVSAFEDWNPKHFLDVAEMTAAVAIGYDWLYSDLDDSTRARLRGAILEHGLQASLKSNAWTRATNNWNQVCNGGITLGALALAETDTALAADLVARAINTVPRSMHEYAPDGAYPEGPGYWGYGTTYNVLLISALQSVFGRDFGLINQPGFLPTADYYLHVNGPSGFYFNYADAGRGGENISPALFWFARQRGDSYLLWHEWPKLESLIKSGAGKGRDHTAALLLLWLAPGQEKPAQPPTFSWAGRGPNPVAFHRSSWSRDATFVAIKGGSAAVNHAHMDVGSFVLDADGVRWADDLGSQDYNSLESKGINLWGKDQNAERWKIFRLGTSSHNVLLVDGQAQRVEGKAPLTLTKEGKTIVDLTTVYTGQLARVQRGALLASDRTAYVQDEYTTLDRATTIRWAMVTRAEVRIAAAGRATLEQAGKHLELRVLEPANASLKIYPTDPPPAATDAPNPGTRMIGFEVRAPANAAQRIVVQFVPGSAKAAAAPSVPLSDW